MKSDLPSEKVYSLDDLEHWPRTGVSLAVLGHPVKHSLSPPMHNSALAELAQTDARFRNWTYYKFDIPPEDLPEALREFHRRGFLGLNLTVPHKVLALRWVTPGESEVEMAGACNTLLRNAHGYTGYNTDLYGLVRAVESDFGIRIRDREVILLGAGGAARAAAVACAQAGVRTLILANRTPSKLKAIVASLDQLKNKPVIRTCGLPGNLPFSSDNLLLVNATSLGLKNGDPAPVVLNDLPRSTLVFDMIYNPPSTALLKQAESLGMPASNGLSMLVFQGERSLQIWTENNPSAKTMLEAAQAGLSHDQSCRKP